jgi:hypothetical protein
MAPSPFLSRRLTLPGCVLVVSAMLLPGCGEDSGATAGGTAKTQAETSTSGKARVATGCPGRVDAFVDSLDALRRQLVIGLSYEQYVAEVKGLKRRYGRLPIDHLTIDCLSATATPAERAFNKYIDAANAWGKCLADASCTMASIEPVLQRKWQVAFGSLSEAQ